MPTTLYDPASGWKALALQSRTDAAGSAVDDVDGEDLRTLLDAFFTEGVVEANAFQVVEDSPTAMTVVIGSGSAKADHAVIDGDNPGQGAYLVRMEDATVDLTVPAADLSNPRVDEVYLVVQDNAYDSSSRVLPRIAYRDGTAATSPSAPGPDAAWDAYLLVATIDVAAGETEITDAEITDERVTSNLTANTVATASLQDDAVTTAKISDDAVTGAKGAPGFLQSFEVDGETENDAGGTITTSVTTLATVNLTIPADWNTWRVAVWAHGQYGDSITMDVWLRIDGTNKNKVRLGAGAGTAFVPLPSLVGYRSGLTTTGSRSFQFQAQSASGSDVFGDIGIYARATRMS